MACIKVVGDTKTGLPSWARRCLLAVTSCLLLIVGCGSESELGTGGRTREDVNASTQKLAKPGGTNGDADYCTNPANRCGAGEGDCDGDVQCLAGLSCERLGPQFNLSATTDVCVASHCANSARDASLGELDVDCGGPCGSCLPSCVGSPGAESFCEGCRCASGQGDCDGDAQCQLGLVCASNRGPRYGLSNTADVCVPAHCTNGTFDAGLETLVDCGGPCRACASSDFDLGDEHACDISAGTVRCWGLNEYGQLGDGTRIDRASPAPVTGLTAQQVLVAAGRSHSCAASNTGEIRCWGRNTFGVFGNNTTTGSNVPVLVTNPPSPVSQLLAGGTHTCVRSGGNVSCWGGNDFGQVGNGSTSGKQLLPAPVQGITTAVHLAIGTRHSCAALANGTVRCWGDNQFKQLGDNSPDAESGMPREVVSVSNAVQVAVSDSASCAMTSSGTVYCWGDNTSNILAIDETVNGQPVHHDGSVPKPVSFVTDAASIASSASTTCVVRANGTARCWGRSDKGQVGHGATVTIDVATSPVATLAGATVVPLSGVTAIQGGGDFLCANTPQALRCWGDDSAGQLGKGTNPLHTVPQVVANPPIVANALAGGDTTSCAIASGQVYCWGQNAFAQLGDGTLLQRRTPALVPGIATAGAIALGTQHGCAALADGTVQCWGDNALRQLGDGTLTARTTPVLVPSLTSAQRISAGNFHTCALRAGGLVTCWGRGSDGQLGHGTFVGASDPVDVAPLPFATALSVGQRHSCAIADQNVYCWGANPDGQLGTSAVPKSAAPILVNGVAEPKAIAAGHRHTCAIAGAGTVLCWGANPDGQLGDGTTTASTSPVTVAGITNARSLTTWGSFTCALLATGEARCWGQNFRGQLGNGTTVSSSVPVSVPGVWVALASGSRHLCGLLTSGQVRCWGYNDYGQTGTGAAWYFPVAAPVAPPQETIWKATQCFADSDCKGGQVCWAEQGPRFELAQGTSVCVDPICRTAPEASCGTAQSRCGKCENEPRVCTSDTQCLLWESCGEGNGEKFALQSTERACWAKGCADPTYFEANCGTVTSACGRCTNAHCENGVKDAGESDVDCGGVCPPCSRGDLCASTSDCGDGLLCGSNNGGCFNGSRAESRCWAPECEDGVDEGQDECGDANSACGPNCACVVPCNADDPQSVCPSGEVCKRNIGPLFSANSRDACVANICPSNDPAFCGYPPSLCGPCFQPPDCSTATCANPGDGVGGECADVCDLGEAGCKTDLHCPPDSVCQTDPDGIRRCRPKICANTLLAPPWPPSGPLCGTPTAPCGAQCPVCVPRCQGRECGDDLCGGSCGTGSCGDGTYCNADGQCVAPTTNPIAKVPNGLGGLQDLPDLPSSPATDGVGAIPGSFSVTALGTPDYTIPIDVPPGRAGIEPALSLKYTGARTNGELGVGWTLDGLSSITRCPRVFAIDGYTAPIKNDPSDAFCLDGKRLIEVTPTQTSGIAEYRTIIDSFARIVAHMDEGPRHQLPELPGHPPLLPETWGPDYFEVWTKDGRILTYGRSRDSLILARSGVRNSWLLTSVRDRAQNTMTIIYENRASQVAADATIQLVRPRVIAYTGHGIGAGSTAGNREVRFIYGSRVDHSLRYVQGAVGWLVDDRLERITTFVDNVAVKSYWLDYKTDAPLSQIEFIKECEGDARTRCKGRTRFQYVEESGFTPGGYLAPISAAAQLDTNGDGIPDFLETIQFVDGKKANLVAKAVSISAGATMAILSFSGALTGPVGLAVSATYMVLKPIVLGLLAHKPEIRYEQNMYLGTGIRSPRLETAIGVGDVRGIPCKPGSPLYFLDFDRDGKDDILGSCDGQLRLALATGDGHFQQPSTALLPVPQYKAKPAVPGSKSGPGAPPIVYDIDGDSLQDVIVCKDLTTLELRRRNPPGSSSAFASPVTLSAPSSSDDPFCGSTGPTRATVDIDGDGTPDLIVRSDQGWKVLRYSLGSLVAPPNLEWKDVEFQDWNGSQKGNGLQFGDFNGDGLLDLFSTDHSFALPPGPALPFFQDRFNAVVWLNTGSGRFTQNRLAIPYVREGEPFSASVYYRTAVLDYDADGRSDILESYHSPERIPGGTWVNWATRILSPNGTVNSLAPSFASDVRIPIGEDGQSIDAPIALAADLDGDGNTDLFAGDNAQAALYGSGLRNTLLSRVEDGLGNFVTVDYGGTSERSGYESTCQGTTWPETCIPRLTSLVTSHSQGFVNASGGDVVERSYEYKYKNARVSATGLGWIGFEQRTITEFSPAAPATDNVRRIVTVDYEGILRTRLNGSVATDLNPPYVYPLADLPKWTTIDVPRESSPIEADPDGYMERTRIANTWKVHVSTSNLSFPYLERRSTTNYEYALSAPPEDPLDDGAFLASCYESFESDKYGNVKDQVSGCQDQYTITSTTFAPNEGTWLISNPEFVTVKGGSTDPEDAQTWDPAYDENGLLSSITRSPAGPVEERHTTTYGDRDEFGNPRTITESVATGEPDRVTTIVYDADNVFPMTITTLSNLPNLPSLSTRVDFDERWGLVKNTVDPNGVATQHTYDGLGRLRKTVDASGTTTHTYAVRRFHYATLTGGLDARTLVTTERKAANCPLLASCADTITAQTEFDHRGRPVRTVSPGLGDGPDVVSERAYDALGRVLGVSMPHAARPVTSGPIIIGQSPYARVTYEYDNLDRVKRVANSDSTGSSLLHAYASRVTLDPQHAHWLENLKCPSNVIVVPRPTWPPDGLPNPPTNAPTNLVDTGCPTFIHHVTDEEQRQDVTVSNFRGQILRNIDGNNVGNTARYSSYHYGLFGRPTHALPNRRTADTFQQVFFHERTYDAYGRVLSVKDPDGNTRTYRYNGFDELRTSLDSKDQLRTFEYDDLGRLTKIIDSREEEEEEEERTTRWIYDQGANALGRLSESISPGTAENPAGQRVVYTYEPVTAGNRGNLKQVNYVIDGVEHPVGFDYDNFGRMKRVHYPNLSGGVPIIAEYKYDRTSGTLTGLDEVGSGTPRQMWRVTGTPFEGHLIQSETFGNGASTTYTYDPSRHFLTGIDTTLSSESVQALEYSHYKNGRVRERTGAGVTQTYTYDALNRLGSLDVGGSLTSYGYDTFGNLNQRGDTSIGFSTAKPYQLASVGANSYFYDLNGNVRERSGPDIPGGVQVIEYTLFELPHTVTSGEPDAIQRTRFEYSADEQRLVQRDEGGVTRYFAGEFYQRTADSSGAGLEERFRLSAGGRNIAEIVRASGSDRTLFFHTDHLGSPDTITTDEGDVIHQEFDPFGSPIGPYDPELTRAGFTGHQHDQNLGLIDMRGRVYDPLAGRFLSTDAIIQAPSWSQGLNLYAYVFNDPVNATDPSGFAAELNGRATVPFVFMPFIWLSRTDPRIVGGVAAGLAVGGLTAYAIGMSPAASSITATAGPSAAGVAGGIGHGLDIAITLIWDPFGPIPSSSTPVKVGVNAMSSHLPTQGGLHAGDMNKGLRSVSLVQEGRPPGTSLFDPGAGALAQAVPGVRSKPDEIGELIVTGHRPDPSPSLPLVPRLELTPPSLAPPASGYGTWFRPSPDQCYNGCIDGLGANYAMDVLLFTTPFAPTLKTPAEFAKTLGGGSRLTTWASRASARLGMPARNWLRSGGRVAAGAVAVPWAFSLGYFATSTAICTVECF